MRCFIAVDIDEAVRTNIARFQDELRDRITAPGQKPPKGIKWVNPELMHLTLKFLGEVLDSEIMRVCETVERISAGHRSFDLEIIGAGVFGRPASVVWAGIVETQPLMDLQTEIDRALTEQGFAEDNRKYTPHLTLCRVKNRKAGRELAEAVKGLNNRALGFFGVDSVNIYKSELTKHGPLYTLVSKSTLKS